MHRIEDKLWNTEPEIQSYKTSSLHTACTINCTQHIYIIHTVQTTRLIKVQKV